MSECPFCGRPLQEGALFCPACMRSINEKTDVTPKLKRFGGIKAVVCAALAFAVVLAALAAVCLRPWGGTHSGGAHPEATEPKGDTMGQFITTAVYVTGARGCSGLWNPDGYVLTRKETDSAGRQWNVYNIPNNLQGVNIDLYLRGDEKEFITCVTGLDDATLKDGEVLSSLMVFALYFERGLGEEEISLLQEKGSGWGEVSPNESHLKARNIQDHVLERCDLDTTPKLLRQRKEIKDSGEYKGQVMLADLRTRVFNGQNEYDIMVLHSCE